MVKFNTDAGLNLVGTFYSCLFFEIHDLGWRQLILSWGFQEWVLFKLLSSSFNSLVIKKVFLISSLNPFYFSWSFRKIRKLLPFWLSIFVTSMLTAVDFLMFTLLCLHCFLFVCGGGKHECFLLLLFVCFKWRQFR